MEHSKQFHSTDNAHILSPGLTHLWMVLVFFAEAIAPSGSRRSTFYHLSLLVSPVVSVWGREEDSGVLWLCFKKMWVSFEVTQWGVLAVDSQH